MVKLAKSLILKAALVAGLSLPPASASLAADPPGEPDADLGGFLTAPLKGTGGAERGPLSPDDIAVITKVEKYLNHMTTVKARFVQISSEGDLVEGSLFLQRPGKMRFEYDEPYPVLLIADGTLLLYYDKDLKSASFIPLSDTPLWFLVDPSISLTSEIDIDRVHEDEATLSVTLRGEETGDAGEVTLVFKENPMTLLMWIITDAQGVSTKVALVDPEYDVEVADALFDYGDLDVYGLERGSRGR